MYKGRYGVIYAAHAGDFIYRYGGQSVKPVDRFAAHRRAARKGENYYVYNWMRSVGVENVQFEILDYADSAEELNLLEILWIERLRGEGFPLTNSNDGGGGQTGLSGELAVGAKLSLADAEEIIRLLSETTETSDSIAKRFGVTGGNVAAIARGTTWPEIERPKNLRQAKRLSNDVAASVISMLADEFSIPDVASKTGVSEDTVGRIARGAYSHIPRPDGFYSGYRKSKKLNEDAVQDIRRRMHEGEGQSAIAERYGISTVMVRNIRRGVMWSHLPDPYKLASRDLRDGKLSDDDVRDIRQRIANGEGNGDIGRLYGMSVSQIWQIKTGATYKKMGW